MTVQSNNDILNYLIGPTFIRDNWLLVLLFERTVENNVKKDHRDYFSHYYVLNVEIKGFSVLMKKNEEETYVTIIEMSRNNCNWLK